jgi:hypothetical protein
MLAIAGLTGLHLSAEQQDGVYRVWVVNPVRADERIMAVWDAELDEYPVFRIGARPVWDEVVDAYFRWVSWGEPDRGRFGLTVTPEGQRIWLDAPGPRGGTAVGPVR